MLGGDPISLPKEPPGDTAAFFQGRRAKQLASACKKETSPSLDPRMDAA